MSKLTINSLSTSRSCLVTDRDQIQTLSLEGCFGSSTRSTKFIPSFVTKTKRKQVKKKQRREEEEESCPTESLQLNLMEAYYLRCKREGQVEVRVDSSEDLLELNRIRAEFDSRYGSSLLTFDERYKPYERYRDAGWIPKNGALYGCDWVLYDKSPNETHSKYCVRIEDPRNASPVLTVLGHMRVAEQTRKRLVISNVQGESIQLKRWVLKHEQVDRRSDE